MPLVIGIVGRRFCTVTSTGDLQEKNPYMFMIKERRPGQKDFPKINRRFSLSLLLIFNAISTLS